MSRPCRSSNFLRRSARHSLNPRARNLTSQSTVEGESGGTSKSGIQDMEQSPALGRYLAEDDHWKAFLVTGEQASREHENSLVKAKKVEKPKCLGLSKISALATYCGQGTADKESVAHIFCHVGAMSVLASLFQGHPPLWLAAHRC